MVCINPEHTVSPWTQYEDCCPGSFYFSVFQNFFFSTSPVILPAMGKQQGSRLNINT
uniref:Uncharacterized protein n=1 Tax=Anguilla anguilla TaxID=7936 RepID=A0A0E9XLL6_ANGAN